MPVACILPAKSSWRFCPLSLTSFPAPQPTQPAVSISYPGFSCSGAVACSKALPILRKEQALQKLASSEATSTKRAMTTITSRSREEAAIGSRQRRHQNMNRRPSSGDGGIVGRKKSSVYHTSSTVSTSSNSRQQERGQTPSKKRPRNIALSASDIDDTNRTGEGRNGRLGGSRVGLKRNLRPPEFFSPSGGGGGNSFGSNSSPASVRQGGGSRRVGVAMMRVEKSRSGLRRRTGERDDHDDNIGDEDSDNGSEEEGKEEDFEDDNGMVLSSGDGSDGSHWDSEEGEGLEGADLGRR